MRTDNLPFSTAVSNARPMAPQPTMPIDFNAMIANNPSNLCDEESPTTDFIYLEAFSAVNEGAILTPL
jgi:hypothetical protein